MKKILILISFLVVIFSTGCHERNKNQFYVKNSSLGSITMNFKGQLFTVANGADLLIDDVPNGTFEYETVYAIPAGVDSTVEEEGLTDKILFGGETRWSIQYVGWLIVDNTDPANPKVTYHIGATLTSTNSSTPIE